MPVSSIFVCTFSTRSGTFRNFVRFFFTESYTICTNMTDSVFYAIKCIIWEILRRLTTRSARRDHTSASYGRSKLTVVAISTLKYPATPEEGRGREGSLRLRTTNFHPCAIQWYQTGPDRTMTSWKCLRNKLELISWCSSFRTCGVPGTDFKDVFTSKKPEFHTRHFSQLYVWHHNLMGELR